MESCPLTKVDDSLLQLYSADDNEVTWLSIVAVTVLQTKRQCSVRFSFFMEQVVNIWNFSSVTAFKHTIKKLTP